MPYTLPEKVQKLEPYDPITGNYAIRLDANESCFSLPPAAMERVLSRIRQSDLRRYPDPYAAECCALAAKRWGVSQKEILAGNGSDELISLLMGCMMPHGGKAAVFREDFSMYAFYASLGEVETVVLPKREDMTIDVDAVLGQLRESGAQMLLFSNPCNPTSLLLPREEVVRLLEGSDALIVVDEAYMEFAGDSVIDLIPRYPNLVVLKTCSKAVGLAGARVGFILGNETLIRALYCVKSPYNVSILNQEAASAVLSDGEYLDGCIEKIKAYLKDFQKALAALQERYPGYLEKIYPSSTNFLYLRVREAEAIRRELGRRGIAVRRLGGNLRISTGLPEENEQVIRAFSEILDMLEKEGVQR